MLSSRGAVGLDETEDGNVAAVLVDKCHSSKAQLG